MPKNKKNHRELQWHGPTYQERKLRELGPVEYWRQYAAYHARCSPCEIVGVDLFIGSGDSYATLTDGRKVKIMNPLFAPL